MKWGVSVLLLLHLLPFVGRPALIGGDEPHYALMAHSIAVDGDIDLENNYAAVAEGASAAGRSFAGKELEPHLIEYEGKRVFSHPLGLPALAVPVLWLQQIVAPGAAPDVPLGLLVLAVTFVALLEGLRLVERHAENRTWARIIGLSVYFSTPLWFYSRTFFTEPFIWAFLVLSVGCIDRRRLMPASLLLGATFLLKESTVLLIAPLLLWAWKCRGRSAALRLALFPGVAFGLFCFKNRWLYGDWLVTFQPYQVGSPLEGLIGLLIDGRHGLMPFAPLALAAIAAWIVTVQGPASSGVDANRLALLAFAGWYLVTALWIDWRGGSGYGPRLLVPVLPALAVPLLATLSTPDRADARRRSLPFVALIGLGVSGFALQWSAVTSPFGAFWSISVRELILGRPLPFLCGMMVGSLAAWWLCAGGGAQGDAARSTLR